MSLEASHSGVCVLLRLFNNETIYEEKESILISSYLIDGTEVALSQIPQDAYVLCVKYRRRMNKRGVIHGGDTQIGITGTVAQEDHLTAVIREVTEETKLAPNSGAIKHISTNGKAQWFCCPINQMTFAGTIKKLESKSHPYKKVGCIIYGSHTDMEHTLRTMPITTNKSNDDICGLVCMHITNVLSAITLARQQKSKRSVFMLNLNSDPDLNSSS